MKVKYIICFRMENEILPARLVFLLQNFEAQDLVNLANAMHKWKELSLTIRLMLFNQSKSTLFVIESAFNQLFQSEFSHPIYCRDDFDSKSWSEFES